MRQAILKNFPAAYQGTVVETYANHDHALVKNTLFDKDP